MLYHSNRMHDAVVSKLIATSRGSPCDSMASCFADRTAARSMIGYNYTYSYGMILSSVCLSVRWTVTKCRAYMTRHDARGLPRPDPHLELDASQLKLS